MHIVRLQLYGSLDVFKCLHRVSQSLVGKRTEVIPSGVSACALYEGEPFKGSAVLAVIDIPYRLPYGRGIIRHLLWFGVGMACPAKSKAEDIAEIKILDFVVRIFAGRQLSAAVAAVPACGGQHTFRGLSAYRRLR